MKTLLKPVVGLFLAVVLTTLVVVASQTSTTIGNTGNGSQQILAEGSNGSGGG
jgi:preprotein translocase subunit SecG